MKKIRATNSKTRELIIELKKKSKNENVKIWKDIAERLEKPKRISPALNVEKLEKYCNIPKA